MRRLHPALWLLAATVVLASCGETARVQVGALAPSVDFGECLGDDTRCEQGFPPARRVEPTFAPAQCERVDDDGWQVAWFRKTANLRCAPVGYCDVRWVSVAEDGTVWTASLGESPVVDSDETLFGLFLVHYGRDGETLAQEVVETRQLLGGGSVFDDNAIQMGIAADPRGHVFVAMVWTEEDAWLGEFDAAARPVGRRVRLGGGWHGSMTPTLSLAPDGSMVLAARTGWGLSEPIQLNAVAKFDSRFQPVWLQSRALPPFGFYAMLSDGPSVVLVGDADPGSLGLSQVGTLDSNGNLVDLLNVPNPYAPFGVDRGGNLFAVGKWLEAPSIATKLTPQGEVLFQVEVISVQDPIDPDIYHQLSKTVDPDGNSFYAVHWDDRTGYEYKEILTLWQLDADGRRCSVSNIENALGGTENVIRVNEGGQLFRINNGDLYLQTQNGIARLTR